MVKKQISVAEFISQQLAYSGRSQVEIAREVGYQKANILSMFKAGITRIPIRKVVPLANALGIQPVHFLGIVMQEYAPETWEVFTQLLGKSLVSDEELKILDIVREASGGNVVVPETEEDVKELNALVSKWRERVESRMEAAVDRAKRDRKAKAS